MNRIAAAALSMLLAVGSASAAGSSAPFNYTPDPSLRTESPAQLSGRVRRACLITQAKAQGTTAEKVESGCACYASRIVRSLDRTELDAYRTTGVFNDSARSKAYATIDACRLRRPA